MKIFGRYGTGIVVVLGLALSMSLAADEGRDDSLSKANKAAINAKGKAEAIEPELPRDPFWPIGYVPVEEVEAKTNGVAVVQRKIVKTFKPNWPKLKTLGSVRTPEGAWQILIKDVGWVKKGNIVKLSRPDAVYFWKVDDVTKNEAKLSTLDAKPRN